MHHRVFFFSATLFTLAAGIQLFLDVAYPIPLETLTVYRPSALALALGTVLFAAVTVGLLTYAIGLFRWLTG